MKRWGIFLLGATLLALTSCTTGPLAPYEWQGTGQTSSTTYAVKLLYTLYGAQLMGSYYLQGATDPSGKAIGTISDGTITMELSPSTTCIFDFAGTITDTRLQGSFVPRSGCYTSSGVWDLVRQR